MATVPKLKALSISRNYLKGINTENISLGDFSFLEVLDFSFNLVDN
jgi:hypothetical protein